MKEMILKYIRTVLEFDDQDLIDDVMNDYFELLRTCLETMRLTLANKDFLKLRQAAHTLKGSSANIGAEPLREVSLNLQKAAEIADEENCKKYFQELEMLTTQLL